MSARNGYRAAVSMATLAVFMCLGAVPASGAGGSVVGYSVDSDDDDYLWRIELTTGVGTPVGWTGFEDIESLSFSADGGLYGVDQTTGQLVTCSTSTGACVAVGWLGDFSFEDTGLTFDSEGKLWMSTDDPEPFYFYSLDPATGAATQIGAQGQKVTGLAFRGGVVYGLGGLPPNGLVIMNTLNGQASAVGPLVAISLVDGGIDFDAAGVLWGIEDQGQIFTVNPATGGATLVAKVVGQTGREVKGFEGLAISPYGEGAFVPEPGTIALLCSGLAGLAGYATLRLRMTR